MKVAEEICSAKNAEGIGEVGLVLLWTGKINDEHQDVSSVRDIGSKCLWSLAGRVRTRLGRLTLVQTYK